MNPKTPMFILAGITDVQERRRYIRFFWTAEKHVRLRSG
jgi:hypothetical protein